LAGLCACTATGNNGDAACQAGPDGGTLPECTCNGSVPGGGAVVVRWRVVDVPSGQLFLRGQCCCDPAMSSAFCSANSGNSCPTSPAWKISDVVLLVTPKGSGASVSGSSSPCVIRTPCVDAELITNFCLAQGVYDLQLGAELFHEVDGGAVCAPGMPELPPAVQRQVLTGQITNLDVVVLGVNAPQPADLSMDLSGDLSSPSDAGLSDASAPDSGPKDSK
jgi:hypothetical protein